MTDMQTKMLYIELKKEIRDWNAEILRCSSKPGGMVPSYAVFGLLDTYETLATILLTENFIKDSTYIRCTKSFKPLLKKMVEEEAQAIKRVINSDKELYNNLITLLEIWKINIEIKETEEKEDGSKTIKP